ncbi:gliding motility-associated C-terminal domain-containing protein [Hymenobacter daecheongensis DSM 21074]|uniref:Gliding motility-associated C-terminal domain-containing protein n=1 Tax=Hymenobacter daecheongensis DSM 21074 TaxID=1121955 RepID=A0A1M6JRC3_9BACT|nr:gliding motility-associated C-terminal domain-containing protein [Hymenobacter daecheongensis]SHJ49259.1 gliding motility-associated C-terminal domain-containing protein [Hymenobacter daecheongensis DSM 21074]
MPGFARVLLRGSLSLLLLLLAATGVRATHIVGGELDLQHVTGSQYRISLNLYFDAVNGNPGALDQDMTVSLFEKASNRRMQNVVLPLGSNTFVAYSNIACTVPSLSTRRLIYTALISLPADQYTSAGGYYAAVERCCRNNGISNIQDPGSAGQTFYLEFPAVVRNGQPFINSTPKIFPPLSDYACRNELFYYSFGGQDADRDSLVYELSTPLNGHSSPGLPKPPVADPAPYEPVQWQPGLSVLNQIPGSPPLSIERLTGRLQVRPRQLGLFVFSIKCAEYRRGVKIGEVRRDFQLQVLDCPRNATPSMSVQMPGRVQPYRAGLDTLRLTPGSNRCLRLRFTDPDPSSTLSLSLNPVNYTGVLPTFSILKGMVHAAGAPDTLVSQLCFPDCLNTRGKVFLLDVIVADDGCSLPRRDTVRVAFTSVPDPNANPTLTTTAGPALPLRARPGDLVTFTLTGLDPDNDPVTLEMRGRGFTPAAFGAQLAQTATSGQTRGTFTWRVDCGAVNRPVFEFEFTAAASPCNERQATSLVVPIQIDYSNAPPVLTTTLPPDSAGRPPTIRRRLGEVYEATLTGIDADANPLALTAAGQSFDLAAAGIRFVPQNGAGRATATFSWNPDCEAVRLNGLEVTFQLQETTCLPQPQKRTVRLEVIPPVAPPFLPANVFTPNGDKLNAYFALPELPPDFCESRLSSIKIFTRWGNEVYRTTDRNFRWDGGGLPAGVYFYLIEYTDKKFKGTVTISL